MTHFKNVVVLCIGYFPEHVFSEHLRFVLYP